MTRAADAVATGPLTFIEAGAHQLGARLGRGQSAEVFTWVNSQVCKLFYEGFPTQYVENECVGGLAAQSAGAPVPMVLGAVRIERRQGLLFERVDGKNLEMLSLTRLWRNADYSRTLAELHCRIHQIAAPETLFAQNDLLTDCLSGAEALPAEAKHRAIEALSKLPVGRQLCHGDFHHGNVIQTPRGPSIIDWTMGNSGSPLADVAATEVILLVPRVPAVLFRALSWLGRLRAAVYISRYREISDFDEQEYAVRFRIALAARLFTISLNAHTSRKLLEMFDRGLTA